MREYFRLDSIWLEKQLIFVCHSMGGILARRFLVSEQAEIIHSNKRIGLFLVASPSLGSTYANFVEAIAPIYNVQLDALRFSQENTWLNALDRDFINLKERKRIPIFGKELVEDNFIIARRAFRRAQLVPPWSGAKYFGEPIKIPYSDHISIAKPINSKALQHRILVDFVRSAIADPVLKEKSDRAQDPSPSDGLIEHTPVESSSGANNPILVEWPKPSPPATGDAPAELQEKTSRLKFTLIGIAAFAVLGVVAFQFNSQVDAYRLQQALVTPARPQFLTGRISWDVVPSVMQQPILSGLNDRQLAEALREKGSV